LKTLLQGSNHTLPDNYHIRERYLGDFGDPGYSITPEALAKAKRMESEYWDWESYEACQVPRVEHPEYAIMTADYKLYMEWNTVLNKLEPLPRLP
jgi:hypothetical protein